VTQDQQLILDRAGLVEALINKHEKFLAEYTSELEKLRKEQKEELELLNEKKREREEAEAKAALLSEKYHLLYNQARKIRMELSKGYNSPELNRILRDIEEREEKLQTTNSPEDEANALEELDRLLTKFSDLTGVDVGAVRETLEKARCVHQELRELPPPPEMPEKTETEKNSERRIFWLEKRIESHHHALAHWRQK